jgi:streptomycin 3"-adenylyltransferase
MLKNKLTDNLIGVYLHGSLAMNSYFPPKSDMDFIIVTSKKLNCVLAETLNTAIARYAGTRPTVGCIECSVIILNTAQKVPEPTPYELHYSEMLHERILNGTVTYGTEQFDSDLPAHLMCVKKRGICLYGMAIDDVFGDVSWQSFLASVIYDFNWIVDSENICDSPYYGVLNICRVLQIVAEENKKYLSKYEGAIWAIEHLPNEYTSLVQKALEVYTSDETVDDCERKTGGVDWDKAALMAFRDYAKERVTI